MGLPGIRQRVCRIEGCCRIEKIFVEYAELEVYNGLLMSLTCLVADSSSVAMSYCTNRILSTVLC